MRIIRIDHGSRELGARPASIDRYAEVLYRAALEMMGRGR